MILIVLFLATIPILLRMTVFLAPPRFLETDAYLNTAALNSYPGQKGAKTSWRNMGYWEVSPRPLSSAVPFRIGRQAESIGGVEYGWLE